jgi:pyruvate dehydrogenase E2 component (dihydrolipoamide acetyltransferase)
MNDVTMPRLSDSMEEGTVLGWLKPEGARVTRGEELVEIETDKATVTYESPADGTLAIVAAVGSALPVGAVIARIEPESAVGAPGPAAETAAAAPASTRTSAIEPAAPDAGDGHVRATPIARRLARAKDVDLASVTGTGPRGRVTRGDVAAVAGIAPAPPAPVVPTSPALAAPVLAPAEGDVVRRELTRLQHVVARRMAEAKATVPEFQVQTEVAMDAALGLRAQLKEQDGDVVVPSINDLVVKACALSLRSHPLANGSYRDGRFELHRRVNVGIAVAARDALLVPTITDADARSLGSVAAEARRLVERVRSGTITPPELSGATFTVSNLGMYGMTAITPVINPPQAGILGVGSTRPVPALANGELVERRVITLTLTCDHRILYGADAAQFLSAVRELLEQPLRLAF